MVNLSDYKGARVTARHALELQLVNRLAWLVLEDVAVEEDGDLLSETEVALCELDLGQACDG